MKAEVAFTPLLAAARALKPYTTPQRWRTRTRLLYLHADGDTLTLSATTGTEASYCPSPQRCFEMWRMVDVRVAGVVDCAMRWWLAGRWFVTCGATVMGPSIESALWGTLAGVEFDELVAAVEGWPPSRSVPA
jgi:hypothetical protein